MYLRIRKQRDDNDPDIMGVVMSRHRELRRAVAQLGTGELLVEEILPLVSRVGDQVCATCVRPMYANIPDPCMPPINPGGDAARKKRR
jgi:hypothetical protein